MPLLSGDDVSPRKTCLTQLSSRYLINTFAKGTAVFTHTRTNTQTHADTDSDRQTDRHADTHTDIYIYMY